MWHSARVLRIGFRAPSYDHPHAAPRNSPAFRVDRRQAAGGVCEQTNPDLLNYIYIYRTKTAANGNLAGGILRILKIADNINASKCNASTILCQYKCKYSYTTATSISYNAVSI